MKRLVFFIIVAVVLGFVMTIVIAWLAAWRGSAEKHAGFGTIERGEVNGQPAAWRVTRHRSFGYEQWQSVPMYGDMVARMREEDLAYTATLTALERTGFVPLVRNADVPNWSRVRGAPDLEETMRYHCESDVIELAAGWPLSAFTATIYSESIGARDRAKQNTQMVIEGDDLTWTLPGGRQLHYRLKPGDGVAGGILLDTGSLISGAWKPARALPMRPLWLGLLVDWCLFSAIWLFLLLAPRAIRRRLRRMRGRCPHCGYNLRGDFDAGCSECGWRRSG